MIKFLSFKELYDLLIGRKGMVEKGKWQAKWTICKYHGNPLPENLYEVKTIANNLLLDDGIEELWKLFSGDPTATPFNQANSYLGVGDSDDEETGSQTGLQATTNKTYKQVLESYPQITGTTITYAALFGPDDANFTWKEYSLRNGNDEESGIAINRKVQVDDEKTSGDSWLLSLALSIV